MVTWGHGAVNARGSGGGGAKVQIGLRPVQKCKGVERKRGRDRGSFAQRETGDRMISGGAFFRSRVSAVRYLLRVFRFGCRCRNVPCPYLVLMT